MHKVSAVIEDRRAEFETRGWLAEVLQAQGFRNSFHGDDRVSIAS